MGCVGFELGGERTTKANALTPHELPMQWLDSRLQWWKGG